MQIIEMGGMFHKILFRGNNRYLLKPYVNKNAFDIAKLDDDSKDQSYGQQYQIEKYDPYHKTNGRSNGDSAKCNKNI